MDRLLRYLETPAGRKRIVDGLHKFTLVVGAIVSAILLTAVIFRHV